jgi:diadenosine hexaphosphate hydrolase (ATP-forming)
MNQNQNKKSRRSRSRASKARRSGKAVRQYSAGGVVYRFVDDRIEILMIQDPLGRWSIPKGHVEEGETIEQTAVREIGEETGLMELKLGEKLDKINFFYRKEGKLIFMTTYVFLAEALGDTDTLLQGDSGGIVATKWFDSVEALKLIEYKDTERLFQLALTKLRSPITAPIE